jgi:hypothetical protein
MDVGGIVICRVITQLDAGLHQAVAALNERVVLLRHLLSGSEVLVSLVQHIDVFWTLQRRRGVAGSALIDENQIVVAELCREIQLVRQYQWGKILNNPASGPALQEDDGIGRRMSARRLENRYRQLDSGAMWITSVCWDGKETAGYIPAFLEPGSQRKLA